MILLDDIRQVTLCFVGGSANTYLVHKDHVDRFVVASKRLHFKPGKNPHNGEGASKIYQITVAALEPGGPFWWSTPDLQNNGDPAGAQIIDARSTEIVWTDSATVNKWRAEEAEAEARYYRELAAETEEVT